MVKKQCRELNCYVADNSNTKKEIKEVTARLKRQIEVLNRKIVKEWFEKNKYVLVEKPSYDVDIQTDAELNTREIGIQTEPELSREEYEKCIREEEKASEIRKKMDEVKGVEEMNELCDREWPEKAFQSTQITGGNPLTIDPENLGIYAETEKLDKGLENRFRERFPDLERVESEEAQATGEVGVLKMTSQRIDKNTKERIIKERVVFKMVHNKKEETESDISVLARNMKCLRNTMTKEGRYNIAMPIPEIGNPSQIRKMIECIFNKSDISISLYTNR